jgi:hypothetical protein
MSTALLAGENINKTKANRRKHGNHAKKKLCYFWFSYFDESRMNKLKNLKNVTPNHKWKYRLEANYEECSTVLRRENTNISSSKV